MSEYFTDPAVASLFHFVAIAVIMTIIIIWGKPK